MGFLKFLKKKHSSDQKGEIGVPLPPPDAKAEEDALPGFADELALDELKLPDIPELEELKSSAGPETPAPTPIEPPKKTPLPKPKIEIPREKPHALESRIGIPREKPHVIENRTEIPREKPLAMQKTEPEKPKLKHVDAYTLTPTESPRPLFGRHEKQETLTRNVFIRGEAYRNMLEMLDSIIAEQKETEEKPQKYASRAEETVYEQFENIAEKLHQKLLAPERMMFE